MRVEGVIRTARPRREPGHRSAQAVSAVCCSWGFQIRYSIHSLYIGLNGGSNKPF